MRALRPDPLADSALRPARSLVALAVLAFALPALSAQVQEGRVADDPQGVQEIDPEEGRRRLEEMRASMPPLFVEVLQDPMRIAPGENGLLLLRVQAPPDGQSKIGIGGSATFDKRQGMLSLGPAKFDPPPAGAKQYKSLLVRIPITVDAKAKYGRLSVKGKLRLPGSFNAPAVPRVSGDAPVNADGGAPPPVAEGGEDPNLIEWAGTIICGRPVPKPVVQKRPEKTASASSADPSARASSGPDAAKKAAPERGTRRAKVEAIAGRDESQASLDEGLLGPDEGQRGGLPQWLFLAVAGAGAALLLIFFLLQKSSKAA